MNFPPWCEDADPQKRARNRLRYLITTTATKVTPEGTLGAFARFCGIDRSSLSIHINRGAMSARMAVAIERAVGADVLRAVDLTNPLDIVAE